MAAGDLEIRLKVGGEDGLRGVARALRAVAADGLRRRLNSNLREEGAPIVQELRAAVRSVEVTSAKGGIAYPDYSRQLRARVASAIRMSIAYKGIRFGVESSRMGPERYNAALAKYLDGELPSYRAWRHPVFGQDKWTVQYGKPWFFQTIRNHSEGFQRACERAMDEVLRDVGRG